MKNPAVKIFFLLICFTSFPIFPQSEASNSLSDFTQGKIDEFMEMRMTLSLLDDRDKAVEKIKDFEKENIPLLRENYGEEDALILENLIVSEVFNYYFDNPPLSTEDFRRLLSVQKEKDDLFIESQKNKKLSAWFWASSGDVYSCWTTFSIKDILLNGITIKNYYLKGYEIDSDCSIILTALGQWYLQAPAIGGGSKKKARQYFEKALSSSRNNAEKYFAAIFLSQFLFEQKEYDTCADLLNKAESLNPGSRYISLIKSQNEAGLSLYQYNRKRSNYDKK